MKNRRSMIVAFLLCACLIVGVGYAAIADQLTVNGTLEYSPTADSLDQNVYFTGHMFIVDSTHTEVETDAFIVDVVGGSQTATITAQFTAANIQQFQVNSNYVSGVVLEIAVENTSTTEELKVNFGDIAMNGTVGTQSVFAVATSLKDGRADTSAEVTTDITVPAGQTQNYYLHIRISAQETMVTQQQTIAPTDFTIVLPVTQVD